MDTWIEAYDTELQQLYIIYKKSLFKSNLQFNKYIPYSLFCKIIYNQSTGAINKFDTYYYTNNEEDVSYNY